MLTVSLSEMRKEAIENRKEASRERREEAKLREEERKQDYEIRRIELEDVDRIHRSETQAKLQRLEEAT